jgi:hypothetical protein
MAGISLPHFKFSIRKYNASTRPTGFPQDEANPAKT